MAVIDHAVSSMTKRTDADPYDCHDKPRPCSDVLVQDGWTEDGRRNMVSRPFMMTVPCMYDMSLSDKRCRSNKVCKWAGSGEAYSERIRRDGK